MDPLLRLCRIPSFGGALVTAGESKIELKLRELRRLVLLRTGEFRSVLPRRMTRHHAEEESRRRTAQAQ